MSKPILEKADWKIASHVEDRMATLIFDVRKAARDVCLDLLHRAEDQNMYYDQVLTFPRPTEAISLGHWAARSGQLTATWGKCGGKYRVLAAWSDIFRLLCSSKNQIQLTPEDMSVLGIRAEVGTPPVLCFRFNHDLQGCNLAAPGRSCGTDENPAAHLCDWKMLGGGPCGRKHAHYEHVYKMSGIRINRFQGIKEESFQLRLPESGRPDLYYVDAANHVHRQDSQDMMTWRMEKSQANAIMYGQDSVMQPWSKYSMNHGKTFGNIYYDRDGGEEEADDDEIDLLNVDGGEQQLNTSTNPYGFKVCVHTPPSVSPKPEKKFKFAPEVEQQEVSMSGRDSLQYRKETKAVRRSIRAELKMLVDSEVSDPLPEVAEVQQVSATVDEIKDEESQAAANARLRERLLRNDLDVSESEDSDCSECDNTDGATAGDQATLPAKNPGASPEDSIVEEKVVHQQQQDGPIAEPWAYDVDETAGNYEVADNLPDDDIRTDMRGLVTVVPDPPPPPADARGSRTASTRGFPDYACPDIPVEHPRLSKINVSAVQPAGIRMGDFVLPARFERRDQACLQLGKTAYPRPDDRHLKLVKRANADDMFVVTGPLPCLKGVKMSYMDSKDKRKCGQCPAMTRVGALYCHTQDVARTRDSTPNHWLCEPCATESLANLLPQSICPTCLAVPFCVFLSPPLRSLKTNQIISEGFRRNTLSMGSREVFINATLPGHLNRIHYERTGRNLVFKGKNYN